MASQIDETLDRRWRNACKVLFKEDIGSLSNYAAWLMKNTEPVVHRKSSVSGKDITYAIGAYPEGAKWIGLDEIDLHRKFAPLTIDETKDVESIATAIQDRLYYTGNIVLGNSGFVKNCSSISDSFYMHEAGKLGDSKYLAYCTVGRLNEDCFGCNGIGESQFCVKAYETFREKRCFEFWMGQNSSDCYYTHNMASCTDCMFCFNLKNKRHAIGNLELEPDKYRSIKAGLLAQIADELKRKKSAPSLIDIVGGVPLAKPMLPPIKEMKPQPTSMSPIEEGFAKTCELLFGKPLVGGIDAYAGWLKRHVRKSEENRSAASGKIVRRWDYCNYFMLPKERILTQEEALAFGEAVKIGAKEADGMALATAGRTIGKLAFFSTEYEEGTNTNCIECPTPTQAANSYRTSPVVYSKYCAYAFWPRSCEHVYGSNTMFDSEFCINCYHSVKLKRCFEMDSCRDCAGSYYCHNCENVQDSMFCFNTKNKKYAIGNAEVGRERFMQAKEMLQKYILGGLFAKKSLETDIYNIGIAKAQKE
ncbi:MAG: hypothetical protein WCT52_02420 [Candidatus Micrarchaeia archaeon]